MSQAGDCVKGRAHRFDVDLRLPVLDLGAKRGNIVVLLQSAAVFLFHFVAKRVLIRRFRLSEHVG